MTDIEIFSAYLPYEVKCKYKHNNHVKILYAFDDFYYMQLILKPLDTIDWVKCESDMGDCFTDNMSRFIQGYLPERGLHILDAPYLLVQWLIKNHYDVFGAIEKEIAISE